MTRSERRGKVDIDDIFSAFDAEFEEMRARMDQMMGNMLSGQFGPDQGTTAYGVSMQMGPDGVPHVREYGNARRLAPVEESGPSQEPLLDVIEEKDKVRVILELPGVQKQDIAVTTEGNLLNVTVGASHRRFSKDIELPCQVRPDTTVANYKNGVLEITMGREPPKRRKKRTTVQ